MMLAYTENLKIYVDTNDINFANEIYKNALSDKLKILLDKALEENCTIIIDIIINPFPQLIFKIKEQDFSNTLATMILENNFKSNNWYFEHLGQFMKTREFTYWELRVRLERSYTSQYIWDDYYFPS